MKNFKRTAYVILTLCSVTLSENHVFGMKRKEPCWDSAEETSAKIQQFIDDIDKDISTDFYRNHIPLTLYRRQGGNMGSIAVELLEGNPDKNTLNNLFDQLALEYYSNHFNTDQNQPKMQELISKFIKEKLLTKFLFACYKQRKNCFSAMNALISLGANINHLTYLPGYKTHPNAPSTTLLIDAVRNKNLKAINFLIDLGANINEQDRSGETALMHAILTKDYALKDCNLIDILLENGASIELTDNDGNIALHDAVRVNDLEVVSLLVNLSENLPTPPLLDTKALGDAQALQEATILWEDCPLDIINYCIKPYLILCKEINKQNKFGVTPLMYAASNNNLDMVKYLLDHGGDASLVSFNSSYGYLRNKTAYDMATDSKVKELLAASL